MNIRNIALFGLSAFITTQSAVSAESLAVLLADKGVVTRAEAASVGSQSSKVYWDGGTRVYFPEDGTTFGINTTIKSRYSFIDPNDAPNRSSFDITDIKFLISGSILQSEFEYGLQTSFVGTKAADGSKAPRLDDAYITWKSCDCLKVKFGQFKSAISRQFVTSDALLQTVDRSLPSDYFNLGRQAGVRVQSALTDSLTLGLGVFNGLSTGEGINRSGVDTKHTGVADLRANFIGTINPYSEGDVEKTASAALNGGVAYAFSNGNDSGTNFDRNTVNADLNLKDDGLSLATEFYWNRTKTKDATGSSAETIGGYLQAGYFLDDKIEAVARYGIVGCDNGSGSGDCANLDQINQVTAGFNYYFWKHNLKAQLNYDLINKDPIGADSKDSNTSRWVLQLVSYL